ncbi:hypothetical protein EYZ11_000266 [Aspergillus tanneri]|uniref:Uncharacterized protein n=1 Tax=Aspergillus tanneri TaxID=1220188 RepID=A0A4S3JXJ3_9EURO|nr:hypothetical protein EYZ11_000266 [Aspergillus tanneri]
MDGITMDPPQSRVSGWNRKYSQYRAYIRNYGP